MTFPFLKSLILRSHLKSVTVFSFLFLLSGFIFPSQVLAQDLIVGMSQERTPIEAFSVPALADEAKVLIIGGLSGHDDSTDNVLSAYNTRANESQLSVGITFIPVANPDNDILQFPPQGTSYENSWSSWSLWRWIGMHAPDVVVIVGEDEYGLGQALQAGTNGLGSIPHILLSSETELLELIRKENNVPSSEARSSLMSRVERSEREAAQALSAIYGQEVSYLTYIQGMALIGRLRLGQVTEVETIMTSFMEQGAEVDITNSLQIAGHLVFAELAELTNDQAYLDLARRVADLGFDEDGLMLEAMPFHGEYSDAFFMQTPLLAKVGKLTGERRYYDLALRHVEFLHEKLIRADGLYNHWPYTEAAWSRGNAFVILGLALALTDFPQDHPGHASLLELYRDHITVLLNYMDTDYMWHNLIDVSGSWAEFSSTVMIATAMQRGINEAWIDSSYQGMIDRVWQSILMRTDSDYGFVNVCASTPGQDSLEAYLNREALVGRDDRAGGMMLMFVTERLQYLDQL